MKDILTFLEHKVRRICSLEAQNIELDHDSTNAQIENKELRVEITQLIINIGDLESQNKTLSKNLNEFDKLKDQAIKEIELLRSTVKCQNNEIDLLKVEINSLKQVNKIVDRKTESDLREKLKHFFEGTLISDDIEDLLNKFDYNNFLHCKPEKITSDSIITLYLTWDKMKKGYEYWSKLYLELYNMEVKKEFIY